MRAPVFSQLSRAIPWTRGGTSISNAPRPCFPHLLHGSAFHPTVLSMIPRYTRREMAAIWEPQTRFRIWFEIEAHAADAMAELGLIPKSAAKAIWDKGR